MLKQNICLICVVFCALLTACNPSASGVTKPNFELADRQIPNEEMSLSRTWESDNFIVRANLPIDMAEQLVKDLEHFRISLLDIHEIKPRDVEPPLEIIFTNQVEDYLGFAAGESSVAFYLPSVFGRKIIVDTDQIYYDPNEVWDTLFHEYVHHFNASYLPYATPLWLNEGSAEYYSTFRNIDGDQFEYGHARQNYISILTARPSDWPDMNAFLKELVDYPIIAGFFGEKAQKRQAYYYALSWLLFHWSENTVEGKLAFAKMKQTLDLGEAVEDAFPSNMNEILLDYAKSLESKPRLYSSDLDREGILDISFSEFTETEYAARLYAQLAFDPGSILKPERMVTLRQVFKDDEALKAYDLLSLSLLSLELNRFSDAKRFILEAEATAPDDMNLLRLSAVIHSAIIGRSTRLLPETIRRRNFQEDTALDIMGRYAELNPGDIDVDFRVMSLKGRYRQSLGKNRIASFDRIRKYEHHKRNPMKALYMVYPLMDEQAFDEAESILNRAQLWNKDALFEETISDMREDLKYNRLAAADTAQ